MLWFPEGAALIKTFSNSPNKDFVRAVDCGFVKEEVEFHGKKLRYFGLPSEGLYDIICWNEFISDFVAVEMGSRFDPSSKQNLLVSKALQLGYYNRLTLMRGEINEIILRDMDDVGTRVPYPFQLINLDYGGSVLYPDRIRIEALEVLMKRQRPADFLLLITSNIREYDHEELCQTQDRIHKEIVQYREDLGDKIKQFFKQINENESLLRQIIHLHFMMKYMAEQNRYEITCIPALAYEGSMGTKLIHYVFRLRYQQSASTRVISNQTLIQILCQNSKELVDGKLIDIKPQLKIG
jgi:hypothetical protein